MITTKAKLPAGAAKHAEALGFEPFAYLTRFQRGLYDATLVYAGSERVELVCERFSRKACIERVVLFLANRAPKS